MNQSVDLIGHYDILKDIMQQLKQINHVALRSRRTSLQPDSSFAYYGMFVLLLWISPFSRSLPFIDWHENSSTSIVLRQALEPYNQITKDICRVCHRLNLNNSTLCYSIELFDSFYSSLVASAIKQRCLFTNTSILDLSFGADFGNKIVNVITSNCCFDYLYWLLLDNQLNLKTRDLYVENYARTVCIITCVFIAAKLNNCQTFPRISQLINLLYSLNVPLEMLQAKLICSVEQKILNSIQFNTNLTTLDTFVETILLIVTRYSLVIDHITNQKLAEMSMMLTQNYYISRFTFLINLFELETGQLFNIHKLEHIERLERLSQDKLLIASGIVASVCLFATNTPSEVFLHLINEITSIDYRRIKCCQNVFLNHILSDN